MVCQKRVKIAGLEVTPFQSMDDALGSIFNTDGSVRSAFALAMNAEKVMSSRSHPEVKAVLELATLRYADGTGVVWALRRKGAVSVKIAGCELWEQVMKRAGESASSVFLVGAEQFVLESTVDKLKRLYKVNIVGYEDGFFQSEKNLLDKITHLKPNIITVAMGSPRQEKFISKCRELHPNAFYMGVGGTYDVFTGKVLRAPAWACRNHIEWLYRLFQSPKRVKRQLLLIPFMLLLLSGKL
ncbi:WecB/TagA/CpsF family glycosyltransferase [Ghiorsea bivora]|uniref:WecB/TagA/CpsF family glycosyltransferase n=1 Tax=Ghiorsea bivora TaxID=1485545 RepID=UPI00056F1370|nr:WecB/TagA/CpsF family glycosyltransferase [Ghiorsea bivora]